MEALDTLLVTCHAQSLNLFVESFLKMVQKLLECNEPELQCLSTSSVSRTYLIRLGLTQACLICLHFINPFKINELADSLPSFCHLIGHYTGDGYSFATTYSFATSAWLGDLVTKKIQDLVCGFLFIF